MKTRPVKELKVGMRIRYKDEYIDNVPYFPSNPIYTILEVNDAGQGFILSGERGARSPSRRHSWEVDASTVEEVLVDDEYIQSINDLIYSSRPTPTVLITPTDLITPNEKTLSKLTPNPMSLISKFKSLIRAEPLKTFVNLGITSEDGVLTKSGQEAFIQWLFESNQTDFYEKFAKPIADAEAAFKN